MNENPEGTPNPLNPAPSFGRVENVPEAGGEAATGTGTPEVTEVTETLDAASFTEPAQPAENNIQSQAITAQDVTAPRPAMRVNHSVVDPMMRPVSRQESSQKPANGFDTLEMDDVAIEELTEDTIAAPNPVVTPPVNNAPELVARDSIVEPAHKKGGKKKVFIGFAIVLLIAAIICGAAAVAIALLSNSNNDRVTKAVDKLLNGEMPTIIAVRGDINSFSSDNSGTTMINIDGAFDTVTAANTVSTSISSELADGTTTSFTFDEIRNKKGDTFFKVGGLDKMMNALNTSTNCAGSANTNCAQPTTSTDTDLTGIFSLVSGLFGTMNDKWILMSNDFASAMDDSPLFDNSSTCLINAFGTLKDYSKDIVNKYKQNQFITYSTDNLEISKKKNELYRIMFDSDKMTAFINSLSNNGFVNELNACVGNTATNTDVAVAEIKKIFENFPIMYVEVDDNNDFTRVYFKAVFAVDGGVTNTTTADLNLSYPQKLEIVEPDEYTDMSTLLNNLLTNLFNE